MRRSLGQPQRSNSSPILLSPYDQFEKENFTLLKGNQVVVDFTDRTHAPHPTLHPVSLGDQFPILNNPFRIEEPYKSSSE